MLWSSGEEEHEDGTHQPVTGDALRWANESFTWSLLFRGLLLHWTLWQMSPCKPFRSCLFTVALWVSWMWALLGFHSQMFWRLIAQVQVLKAGCTLFEVWTLHSLREKFWVCKFPPHCGLCAWRWVYGMISSWYGLFLVWYERIVQVVFRSFSEEIVPYVVIAFKCVQGRRGVQDLLTLPSCTALALEYSHNIQLIIPNIFSKYSAVFNSSTLKSTYWLYRY